MENKDSKTIIKKIFKKGSQTYKLSLGFVTKTKELASTFISKSLDCIKNLGLFVLGLFVWPLIFAKNGALFLWEFGKNTWVNIKKSFYNTLGVLIALFCVCFVLVCLFILINHINPTFIAALHSKYIITPDGNNFETIKTLNEFVTQGKIINASEIYNHVLEYYNSLITILIALIGVFGAISWFTIQGKANYEVKTSIENKFESEKFNKDLGEKISSKLEEITKGPDFWEHLTSDNMEEIISCLLKDERLIKLLNEEKEDILHKKKEKTPEELDGVEDGDKV